MTKSPLRREHVVAASLVGAVVVVVGFASGLGTRPVTTGQAPSDDDTVEAAPQPEPQQPPQDSPPQANPPVHHTGPGGNAPVTTPPGTGHTGHPEPPTQPPTTPPTMPPSTPPDPDEPENPCEPGFVPRSLDTLLATLTRATDTIELPGGLSPAPLGLAPTTVPTLVDGSTGLAPLDQLLATCEPATRDTAPTTPTPTPETTTSAPLPLLGG